MLQALFGYYLTASRNRREYPWLGSLVSVCTLSQVDFLGECVGKVLGC